MKAITQLEELKQIELDIMKQIHEFCVEKDITYYLHAGTLLGAIRHQGFIPWDDDIDIIMPRPDYERFLKEFPEYGAEKNLQIVNHTTKPYYARPFSKVINTKTVLNDLAFKGSDPIGVFVDIWVLDGMPEDEKAREKFLSKMKFYKKMLYAKTTKISKGNGLKKNLFIVFGSFINRNKLIDKIIKCEKSNSYENSTYVSNFAGTIVLWKKEYFGTPMLMPFEDTKFYVPQNYDEVLKIRFGEYMKLPPENERVPHHIINTYWKDEEAGNE